LLSVISVSFLQIEITGQCQSGKRCGRLSLPRCTFQKSLGISISGAPYNGACAQTVITKHEGHCLALKWRTARYPIGDGCVDVVAGFVVALHPSLGFKLTRGPGIMTFVLNAAAAAASASRALAWPTCSRFKGFGASLAGCNCQVPSLVLAITGAVVFRLTL
jgi:hypothetical protein